MNGTPEQDNTGSVDSRRNGRNVGKEEWYSLIFENDDDPIFVFQLNNGKALNLIDVNGAACRNLGCSREKLLETSIAELVDEYGASEIAAIIEKLPSSRRATADFFLKREGGAFIPVGAHFTLFEADGAQMVLMVAHAHPESSQMEKDLEIAEQRIGAIIKTVGEGIIVIDGDSNILYVNHELLNIFGYGIEELIGEHVHMLMPEKYRAAHTAGVERYTKGGEARVLGKRIELEGVRKDGTVFPLEIRVEETKINPASSLFTAAIRDITGRKAAEEALKVAKDRAEEATKLKDKFVSLVAHDLKSPLTSMVGLLRLVNRDVGATLPVKYKEMLHHIGKSGERIIQIIDDLLNISRLQTGAMKPEPKFIDASITANAAIDSFKYVAQEKDVSLENLVAPGSRIFADPSLFEQVLENLLSNAIKFSPKGAKVELFVPEGKKSSLAVRDCGAGIKQDMVPNLFKHDVKTSTVGTGGERGTGLGLPYCHDIMRAHNGSIRVETTLGTGSVFYVELPETKPVIMVVEDEKIVRKVYRRYLEVIDAEVVEATNGAEALELLEKSLPNLVIMDIFMPVMGGFELLSRIRSEPKTKSLPVIVVTSDSNMETREKAFRLGANDFVSKLMEPNDFIPRVRRFVI